MLYLIRHEETPFNAAGINRGTDDPPLSAKGRSMAVSTGGMLRGKVDRVVADKATRTQQSAKLMFPNHKIETDSRLGTLDIGQYSGKKSNGSEGKEFDSKYVDHPDRQIPGGESVNHWMPKWKATYHDYLGQSKHENIALVTHGRPVSAAVHGFTPESLKEKNVPKLGCCVYQVGNDRVPRKINAAQKSAPKMNLSELARA